MSPARLAHNIVDSITYISDFESYENKLMYVVSIFVIAFVNASKVTTLTYFASPSNVKMDRASAIIHKKRFESILILNLFRTKNKIKIRRSEDN